jgi:hypothetical protein
VGFCIRPVVPQFGERNSGHRALGTEKAQGWGLAELANAFEDQMLLKPGSVHLLYGIWNATLLSSVVPVKVVTVTVPLVAPVGTVVVISEAETTLNVAAVPLKLTAVAPFRFVPRMVTLVRTLPDAGTVSTNAPSPVARLKTVP